MDSWLFILLAILFIGQTYCDQPSIWPLPWHYSSGDQITLISTKLLCTGNGIPTLMKACARYKKQIFLHEDVKMEFEGKRFNLITKIEFEIEDESEDYPTFQTSEEYSLSIPSNDHESITIEAPTIYGALRGLETLSQLIEFDFEKEKYLVQNTPWMISDAPRFNHR